MSIKNGMFGLLALAATLTVLARLGLGQESPRAGLPAFKRAMIVVFENTDYAEALNAPFFGDLARRGALFSNFIAEAHPSQPNYVAMIAGDKLGVKSDSNTDLDGSQIGDLLRAKGMSWKVYAENYPGDCFTGASRGKYARKHVPFISFNSVQNDPAECGKIVESAQLDQDIAAGHLPEFSMYIPNLDNDGHDTGVAVADAWFKKAFGARLEDPRFIQDTLLVVTFDESENHGSRNQIFTALYGANIVPGSVVSSETSHYSVLRTIEDTLGLGNLGRNDANARPISGIWK